MKATFCAVAICLVICVSIMDTKSLGKRLKKEISDENITDYSKPGGAKPPKPSMDSGETEAQRRLKRDTSEEVADDYSRPDQPEATQDLLTPGVNATLIRSKRVAPGVVIAFAQLAAQVAKLMVNVIGSLDRVIVVQNLLGRYCNLRCWSGDDNMGWHRLEDSESFVFKFKANFWGNTLFSCNAVSYGEGMGKVDLIWTVYGGRAGSPSGTSHWKLYGYGFYMNDNRRIEW